MQVVNNYKFYYFSGKITYALHLNFEVKDEN